jgi:hypothetical protein
VVEPVFTDARHDFGVTENFVGAALAWLDPERFVAKLEAMIDETPQRGEPMTGPEQAKRMGELTAEIERLSRLEEALISAAFEQDGTDVLRRRDALPAAVLGVAVVSAQAADRPSRRPRPVQARQAAE